MAGEGDMSVSQTAPSVRRAVKAGLSGTRTLLAPSVVHDRTETDDGTKRLSVLCRHVSLDGPLYDQSSIL